MPPVRTCIACRRRDPARELIRLVADAEGQVRVDRSGRLGGRGAWIHPQRSCVQKVARESRRLSSALRQPVRVEGLPEAVRDTIRRRVLDALSLCARSGLVEGGAERLARVASRPDLLGYVVAADAAPRSVGAATGRREDLPVHHLDLDRENLGARVGSGPRAVLAFRRGQPADHLFRELRRLEALG